MGTLTVSTLNDVSAYRSSGTALSGSDVMEISLSGTTGHVSAKCTLANLQAYLNFVPANTTYKVFDIFYRTINETPLQITYLNNTYGTGVTNLYSAWPLFIDPAAAGGDTSINNAAPNWVAQGNTNLQTVYTTFWSKLSAATGGFNVATQSKLKWESVNINSISTYVNSTYMNEYNAQGYTGRFLIDIANGYVAAPILNNTFVRNVSAGTDFSTSEMDTLQNITGQFLANSSAVVSGVFSQTTLQASVGGGGQGRITVFDASTVARTSTETKPKNVHYCPYMQIANTITELDLVNVNAALSGYAVSPASISEVADTTASGNTLSLSATVTPYNLFGGLTTVANQNLSNTGFQKLPGGLIMQWGTFTNPLTEGTFAVTFPIAFPSVCLNVQLTVSNPDNSTAGNRDYWVQMGSPLPTALGFTAMLQNATQSTIAGITYWFAIGY